MLNSNIINIITTLYFKNKFNNVLKQIRRVQHKIKTAIGNINCHDITINKKKYNIMFRYRDNRDCNFLSCKYISRKNRYYAIHCFVYNTPRVLHWGCSPDIEDYCNHDADYNNINHINEMERNVINYFNTLKPMERTIKIKKINK